MTSYIQETEVIAAASAAKRRDRAQRQKTTNISSYEKSKSKINRPKGKKMDGIFTGTLDINAGERPRLISDDAQRMALSRLNTDEAQARREAFIRECDETTATLGPDSTIRLSQIEDVAEEIVAASGADHGQAVRMALDEAGATGGRGTVTPNQYGSSYPHREEDEIIEMAVPTDAEVSSFAAQRNTDYGTAARHIITDRQEKALASHHPAGLGQVFQYTEDEMKQAMKERGYDVE